MAFVWIVALIVIAVAAHQIGKLWRT